MQTYSQRNFVTETGPTQHQSTRTVTNYGPNGTQTVVSSSNTSGGPQGMSAYPGPNINNRTASALHQAKPSPSYSMTESTTTKYASTTTVPQGGAPPMTMNAIMYDQVSRPSMPPPPPPSYAKPSMPFEGMPAGNVQTSTVYSESTQRYVPIGTHPVKQFPHNIKMIYDPNLVPAFMAPPTVSVSPAYVAKWAVGSAAQGQTSSPTTSYSMNQIAR